MDSVTHGAIFTAIPYTFRSASHRPTALAGAGSLMQRQALADEIKSVNLLFILVATLEAYIVYLYIYICVSVCVHV